MRRNRKLFKRWTLKGTIMVGFVTFLLVLGITFAQQMGQLDFIGIANTYDYEVEFIAPVFHQGGKAAVLNNLPTGVTQLNVQEWDGDNLTLYLQKPLTFSNDTGSQWTCTYTITNISNFPFSNGQVSVSDWSGNWSSSGPSISALLSKTIVDRGTNFDVQITFNSTVSVSTVDHAKLTISFVQLGQIKTFDIDVYFVPYDYLTPPVPSIIYNPAGPTWTNQNVTSTISFNKQGVTITNNSGNNTYVFSSNGTFTYNYKDAIGNTGTAVATVNWIDKIAPDSFGLAVSSSTINSITITGSTIDQGGSGIAGYQFSCDNGASWTSISTSTTHTCTGLSVNVQYSMKTRAWDNAGNSTDSTTLTKKIVTYDFIVPVTAHTGPSSGSRWTNPADIVNKTSKTANYTYIEDRNTDFNAYYSMQNIGNIPQIPSGAKIIAGTLYSDMEFQNSVLLLSLDCVYKISATGVTISGTETLKANAGTTTPATKSSTFTSYPAIGSNLDFILYGRMNIGAGTSAIRIRVYNIYAKFTAQWVE